MKKVEFRDFNLEIKLGGFINIIGSPASGKTTILKMLINQIYNPNIFIDDKPLEEYDLEFKRKNIAAALFNFSFNTEYVKEELVYYQEKIGIDLNTSYENINKFIKYFELGTLVEAKISYLTKAEKALVKILSLLIIKPEILGIDNLLTYLNTSLKLRIIKYAKENKITILNVTSNSEELLFPSDIIVLDKFKLIEYNSNKKILTNEKLLLSVGFDLPFIVSLSNGLNAYELIKKDYYDNESLVGEIWK